MSSFSPDEPRDPLTAAAPPTTRTMPPPELLDREAPDSAGEVVREHVRPDVSLSRYAGPRAEEAYWRGRVDELRATGDVEGELGASIELSRLLASRGTDLDTAVALAARALEIADDATLRTDLAGWLVGLGQSAHAAETLRGLTAEGRPAESARILVKTAVLLARGNDPAGAAEALREASELDPQQAMANELLGTLAAWAPEAVAPEWAAASFLEAARRREAAHERDAAFEDRLRAFEIAPHHEGAAAAIAGALAARGRLAAADEILRWHAAALSEIDPARSRSIHIRRALAWREGGVSSIGALLDAGLDGDLEIEAAAEVDQLLARAGLFEVLAARLEIRAEREPVEARTATFQALAELYAGSLGRPDQAVEAWLEALASDPGSTAAIRALREHATSTHDFTALAEAIIRLGEGVHRAAAPADLAARAAALKELIPVVQKALPDPALASWADQRMAMAAKRPDAPSDAAMGRPARTQSIMMFRVDPDADDAMAAAEALDSATTPEARMAALRRLAKIYRGRPHARAEYLDVLSELAMALPGEREFTVALERMTSRTGELDPIEGVMRARLLGNLPQAEVVRARMWLGTIARRRGDELRALEEMAPLLVEAPDHRGALAAVLVAASRVGDAARRAEALALLANGLQAQQLKAVLLAVAAELNASVGADEIAQQTAELAIEADPSSPRALATLAMLTARMEGRAAAVTVERAINAIAPNGLLCERLSGALEALEEAPLALAWTQRWVALRPGCPRAIAALMHRATVLNEPVKLAEALGWVLAQPKPLADIEELLEAALVALFPIDRPRALALARRSLDVLGPTLPTLRMQLLSIAERAGDQAFAISVLERWLAIETMDEQVVDLVLELCRRRLLARDLDGAARELVRAVEYGADPMHVLERADAIDMASHERGAHQSSDRMVSVAAARARALLAMGPELRVEASDAWRKLGSLLWDLAADHRGADAAFFMASQLAPEGGPAIYAQDLCEFVGPEEAVAMLRTRADGMLSADEEQARAALLIEAANLATTCNLFEEALEAAKAAIEIDPTRADAIVLVERAAHVPGGIAALDQCYQRLSDASLGLYGRKAAHYRAARQLEKRGEEKLALRHAIACFEQLPGAGTVFALMARLAERTGDVIDVVRALKRVADKSNPDARAEWYKRAAAIAGSTDDGALTRFDMLLSALNARPDPATVELVGAALRQFIAITGEVDVAAMRFERAVKAMLTRLEGPDGARAAIALARVAFGPLGAISTGIACLERAMMVDGDIEEFATLIDQVPMLVKEPVLAERFLASVRSTAEKPYSSVGAALLRMASRLAGALGQEIASAALLIHAAKRDHDDEELVSEAHAVVNDLGDIDLLRALDQAVPVRRRLEALLEVADRRERDGADADAIVALERALVTGGVLKGEERDRVALRLRHLLGMARRNADIEALLRTELQRDDLTPPVRVRLARDLAAILALRADHRGALDLFASAVRGTVVDAPILDELHRLGRRVPDGDRHAEVLRDLADHAPDDATRALLLRELAPLLEELGDREAAVASYRAIARIHPGDSSAIEGLERDANDRADHEALTELLRQRIETAPPEERRALRLRRAAALEQRLGRPEDACAELETLLTETPDDKSALRFLADILDRLGRPLRAAPLLRKLGDLATPIDEKAEYGLRAAASFLSGGDVASAKATLDAVAPFAARESVIELRGKIARQEGDFLGLAQALDQLSSASSEPAERRAEMLLDASAAAGSAGDDLLAMELARRALKMAPTHPGAILEARRLEYKARGGGTPRDAQAAVEDLGRVKEGLSPEQIDLHAFLLAEALDVNQGKGAGLRELTRRREESGSSPLISLGLAERLLRSKKFKEAVPLFEAALSGNLHGVRSRGRVAVAGADAAMAAGDLETAARLLGLAASEPDTRALALRRQLDLTAARTDPAAARAAIEGSSTSSTPPPPSSGPSPSSAPPTSSAPASSSPRSLPPPSSRIVFAGHSPEEVALYLQLVGGSFDAGEKLIALYGAKEAERSHDILVVRKHQAALLPGDRVALERLRDAATLDTNLPYAQAIEHVLQGFAGGSSSPPAPPPLSFQRETPDLLKPLLFGPSPSPVHEALAMVLETGMYRRDIAHSGLAGALRVQPGAGTVLADLWGSLTRVMGLLRTSLFHPRSSAAPHPPHSLEAPGPLFAHVALLSPPAVVLTGDVQRETPELSFLLGSMLAGSMPEHALVNGLAEDALRSLISALLAAFGPLEGSSQRDPAVVRLGQNLWQLIPPRAARRLHEICADPERLSFEAAIAGTQRVMRRAGLFAAGDLPAAVRMTVAELSLPLAAPITDLEGLAAACRAHPPLADLVRLATSSEYADARWQSAATPVLRRSDAAAASRSRIGA